MFFKDCTKYENQIYWFPEFWLNTNIKCICSSQPDQIQLLSKLVSCKLIGWIQIQISNLFLTKKLSINIRRSDSWCLIFKCLNRFVLHWGGQAGRLFPREPVNFVHRKWTVSQEISQNISKVLTNLTYFYHIVDEKSLEFQQIWTYDVFSVV